VAKVRRRLAGDTEPRTPVTEPPSAPLTDVRGSVAEVVYNPIREVMDSNGRIYYISH